MFAARPSDDPDSLAHVQLTTVSQRAGGQAREAVAAAAARLDGDREDPVEVVLPAELVVRGTTAGPRAVHRQTVVEETLDGAGRKEH